MNNHAPRDYTWFILVPAWLALAAWLAWVAGAFGGPPPPIHGLTNVPVTKEQGR